MRGDAVIGTRRAALRPGATVLAAALWAGAAAAQATPPVTLRAAAALELTATDNQRLAATEPRAELVVSPQLNLRLAARGAVLRGDVDYTLSGLHYTRDSEGDSLQNQLRGTLAATSLDGRASVVADGSISQQPRAAFSRFGGDASLGREADRTEVRTLQIAPTLQGRLGPGYEWNGRLALRSTRSSDDASAAVDTVSSRVAIAADGSGARVVPGLTLVGNIYDFDAGRRNSQAELLSSLTIAVDTDLRVGVQAGVETNNFRTAERVSSSIWGATLSWDPSPRTKLDLQAQHRDPSNSHDISFQHRFPRSAVQFRQSRTISAPDATTTGVNVGSAYDVLFFQFASLEPDPDKRKPLVEAYLRANNVDPRQPVLSNFLTNSLTEQRTQSLVGSWTGLRTTVTLGVSGSRSSRVDNLVPPTGGDGFSASDELRQSGATFALSHRLNPTLDLGVDASVQRTADEGSRRTSVRSAGLLVSMRLDPRTSVSLGARHVESRSNVDPYQATVLSTTARMEF